MAKRVGLIVTLVAAAAIAVASVAAFKDKLVDLRAVAADTGSFDDLATTSDAVQKNLSDIKGKIDKIPKRWSAFNISNLGQAEQDVKELETKLNDTDSKIKDLRFRIGLVADGSAKKLLLAELKKLEGAFADLDAQVKAAEASITNAKDLRDNPKKAAEEMSRLLAR